MLYFKSLLPMLDIFFLTKTFQLFPKVSLVLFAPLYRSKMTIKEEKTREPEIE